MFRPEIAGFDELNPFIDCQVCGLDVILKRNKPPSLPSKKLPFESNAPACRSACGPVPFTEVMFVHTNPPVVVMNGEPVAPPTMTKLGLVGLTVMVLSYSP